MGTETPSTLQVVPEGILRKWLEEGGYLSYLDAPFEVDAELYAAKLAEAARAHPDYDQDRRHAWAVISVIGRKFISRQDQEQLGAASDSVSRVALSMEQQSKEFRAFSIRVSDLRETIGAAFDVVHQDRQALNDVLRLLDQQATERASGFVQLVTNSRDIVLGDVERTGKSLGEDLRAIHREVFRSKAERVVMWIWRILIVGLLGGLLAQASFGQHLARIDPANYRINLLAQDPSGSGDPVGQRLSIRLEQGGSTLARVPSGLVVFNCSTNMTCTWTAATRTFALTSTGGGSSTFLALTDTPSSYSAQALKFVRVNAGETALEFTTASGAVSWDAITNPGAGQALTMAAFASTWTWNAATGAGINLINWTDTASNTGTGYLLNLTTAASSALKPLRFCYRGTTDCIKLDTLQLDFAGAAHINASKIQGQLWSTSAPSTDGQLPIWNAASSTWVPGDPLVSGFAAHDAPGAALNPVAVGGYASAAAPADVSADVDVVRMWLLRNGSPVVNLASGGTLIDPRAITSLPAITGAVTANAGTNLNTSALALDATLTNRLPAGSTPADNESNAITASRLGNFNFIFDGIAWDRWTGQVTIGGTLPAFGSTPTFNIGTFPDNEPFNVAQINGVTTLMGNGVTGTGSQRVTIASDNTAFTVNIGTFPDNEPFNVAQINGVTPLMGNGVTGTGSLRVTLASDTTSNTNPLLVAGGLTHNGAASAGNRVGTLPAIARITYQSLTSARDASLQVGLDGLLHVTQMPSVSIESYRAADTVASAASATDIAVLSGNATDTVLVTRVVVTCTQTTAGQITLFLIKRSTADTAGTSVGMTEVPDDANYAAASSAGLTYTANPTVGSLVGNVDVAKIGCMAAATATPNDIYVFRPLKPIVLRGTAQQLAVNLGGVTVSGGSFSILYEWIETTTP